VPEIMPDYFINASLFLCLDIQGNMVILVRCEEEDVDEEGANLLQRGLVHQCNLALHVEGLPTGYCRDIHGQVWFIVKTPLILCNKWP